MRLRGMEGQTPVRGADWVIGCWVLGCGWGGSSRGRGGGPPAARRCVCVFSLPPDVFSYTLMPAPWPALSAAGGVTSDLSRAACCARAAFTTLHSHAGGVTTRCCQVATFWRAHERRRAALYSITPEGRPEASPPGGDVLARAATATLRSALWSVVWAAGYPATLLATRRSYGRAALCTPPRRRAKW